MDSFNRVAPHYETLMAEVPYSMWTGYLRLIWASRGLQPADVLEIACGTGRICRMLAADGLTMTGIDISPAMIAEALALGSPGAPIEYHVQDAAELSVPKAFDAAFSFFDSLNNILEFPRFASAVSRAFDHLRPTGVFLFDLNTAYAFEKRMFDLSDMKKTSKVRYDWRSDWDPVSRICEITMDFWTDTESFREVHVQRAYSLQEIEVAMDDAGFSEVQIYDAYTLNPPRKNSDRIHVMGVRK